MRKRDVLELRRYLPVVLAVVLLAMGSLIWWQNGRIQKLEKQQTQTTLAYATDILSGVIFAQSDLENALRHLKADQLAAGVLDLHDALHGINVAEGGAHTYNGMLSSNGHSRIAIFDEIITYGITIVDLSHEIRAAGGVSSDQLATIEDIDYDLKLINKQLIGAWSEDKPETVALALNENDVLNNIKTQSVRQRLNLRPNLSSLDVRFVSVDLLAISLASPTNCVMAGEPLTLTLTISNEQEQTITMLDTPPLDIAIINRDGAVRDLWSYSETFPVPLDLALEPGETQSYQWVWLPNAQYGTPITIQAEAHSSQDKQTVELEIGIDALPYTDAEGNDQIISCLDL